MAVALLPETVHTPGVSERNDTASFEVADADRVIRLDGLRRPRGGVKLIVCGIFWTAKDRVTGVAGAYLSSPGWEAVMVQVPAVAGVTLMPETVHTAGVSWCRTRPARSRPTRTG